MQLYHRTCSSTPENKRLSRMELISQNVQVATRTYRCEDCQTVVHIDMDWEEGAIPESTARLD